MTVTDKTITKSAETYTKSNLTRDADGFFASLSANGNATFASKITLDDPTKNLAHQIELAGIRNVAIINYRFTGFNG